MGRIQTTPKAIVQRAPGVLQSTAMKTRWYYIDQKVILLDDGNGSPIMVFRAGHPGREHCEQVARRTGFDIQSENEGYYTLRSNGCELL